MEHHWIYQHKFNGNLRRPGKKRSERSVGEKNGWKLSKFDLKTLIYMSKKLMNSKDKFKDHHTDTHHNKTVECQRQG